MILSLGRTGSRGQAAGRRPYVLKARDEATLFLFPLPLVGEDARRAGEGL